MPLASKFGPLKITDMFAQSSQTMMLTDMDGQCLDINDQARVLFNLPAKAMLADSLFDTIEDVLVSRRLRNDIHQALEQGAPGIKPRFVTICHDDENLMRLWTVCSLIKDGSGATYPFFVFHDIPDEAEQTVDMESCLTHGADVGLLLLDEQGNLLHCNDWVGETTGFPAQKLNASNFNWANHILDGDGAKRLTQCLAQTRPTENRPVRYRFNAQMKRHDGTMIPVHISLRDLGCDPEQTPLAPGLLICSLIDASESRAYEQELEASEAFWKSVVDKSGNGVLIAYANLVTYDMKLIYTNSAFANIIGYSAEELDAPDFSYLDILPPDTSEQRHFNFKRALSGENISIESVYRRKDGGLTPVKIFCSLLPDLTETGNRQLFIVATDISEIKKREENLLRMKTALDVVSTNVMIVSAEHELVYENEANHRFWKDRESLIQKAIPDFRPQGIVGNYIDSYHKEPESQHAILARLVHEGGENRAVINLANFELQTRARAIFNEKNESIGYVIEVSDLTDQREREAAVEGFMKSAMEGMGILDFKGRIYEINQHYADLLGYSREEILSPAFNWRESLCFSERLEAFFSAWAADPDFQQGRLYRDETMMRKRDGTQIPCIIGIRKLPRRGHWSEDRYLTVMYDLSELKAKELEIAQARETFLFDSVTEGLMSFDVQGTIYKVNPACVDLLGSSESNLLDRGLIPFIPPEIVQSTLEHIREASVEHTVRFEMELIHSDGHRIPIAIAFRMLEPRQEWQQDRLIATIEDISERLEKQHRIEMLLETQRKAVRAIAERLSILADGNLIAVAPGRLEGDLARVEEDMNTLAATLRETVASIQKSAVHCNHRIDVLEQGNHYLNQRTQQQAASMEEIRAFVEELGSSGQDSTYSAERTNIRSGEVRDLAERGAAIIYSTIEKMRAIHDYGKKITDIIEVLDSIAFTTNILALNAAVEAAHAGDAGRGFAVVAQEVRCLSQSSATHAKGIRKLIRETNAMVSEGHDMANQSGTTFTDIIKGIKEVSELINNVAHSEENQQRTITQLMDSINEINGITQENSTLVDENAAASSALREDALKLRALVSFFKTA